MVDGSIEDRWGGGDDDDDDDNEEASLAAARVGLGVKQGHFVGVLREFLGGGGSSGRGGK